VNPLLIRELLKDNNFLEVRTAIKELISFQLLNDLLSPDDHTSYVRVLFLLEKQENTKEEEVIRKEEERARTRAIVEERFEKVGKNLFGDLNDPASIEAAAATAATTPIAITTTTTAVTTTATTVNPSRTTNTTTHKTFTTPISSSSGNCHP
jgi:hypothetical protein